MRFEFEAELWEYDGEAPWVFVTVPAAIAESIREFGVVRRPFGSVKVTVGIGSTTWQTSLFPDSESGSYVLPIKAEVRRRQSLFIGAAARVNMQVED